MKKLSLLYTWRDDVEMRKSIVNKYDGINKYFFQYLISSIEKDIYNKFILSKKDNIDEFKNYLYLRLNDFDRSFNINKGVVLLKKSESRINTQFNKLFSEMFTTYSDMKINYPIIIEKYLPNMNIDRNYYQVNYFNKIEKLITLSYRSILNHEFNKAHVYRIRVGELIDKVNKILKQVRKVNKKLEMSKRILTEYGSDLSVNNDTLYSKVYKNITKTNRGLIISAWNILNSDIGDYRKELVSYKPDYIKMALMLKKIIDDLNSIETLIIASETYIPCI